MIKEVIVQIKVEEYGPELYRINDTGSLVRKSLCTVISDDTEQEDNEFVLPEKWCVSHCKESLAWIQKNSEIGGDFITVNRYYMFPNNNHMSNSSYAFPEGYAEITQDQFFAHVWEKELKKEEIEPVPVAQETTEPIPFDLEKYNKGKYNIVTSGGYSFRLLCTNREYEDVPLFGFEKIDDQEIGRAYTIHGKGNKDHDLFLVAKTETVFVNRFESTQKYKSEEDAKFHASLLLDFEGFEFIETIEVKRPIK